MMNQLTKHNRSLQNLLENGDEKFDSGILSQMVDLDSIDLVLRECLTIDDMRDAGSFFTGQKLATSVVNAFAEPITFSSRVLDPTCGAGNLLIECSRRLGIESTLSKTLKKWGQVLWGFDLNFSFIEASKLRIIVEALRRGVKKDCSLNSALEYLNNIKVQDVMDIKTLDVIDVTHVILNPPFTIWPSPKENYWKKGKVNAAGVVFDKLIRLLPANTCISAIFPDVLRSGSRYKNFRDFVSSKLHGTCTVWGRFNTKTDVDVFILNGLINENQSEISWFDSLEHYEKLEDRFNVRIGPLVAYRDLEEGDLYAYIHPKNCPKWEVLDVVTERRRFSGAVIKSPFVVVKRTSSPSDNSRASATIVSMQEPVAVENHLIVISPKSGLLKDCKKLLKTLKSEKTNSFLNDRARMRHLTVDVIKSLPI